MLKKLTNNNPSNKEDTAPADAYPSSIIHKDTKNTSKAKI